MSRAHATGKLSEVAAILLQSGDLLCAPVVEDFGDRLVLTVTVPKVVIEASELTGELEHLERLCQVRAFAQSYGIPSELLDPLLLQRGA